MVPYEDTFIEQAGLNGFQCIRCGGALGTWEDLTGKRCNEVFIVPEKIERDTSLDDLDDELNKALKDFFDENEQY